LPASLKIGGLGAFDDTRGIAAKLALPPLVFGALGCGAFPLDPALVETHDGPSVSKLASVRASQMRVLRLLLEAAAIKIDQFINEIVGQAHQEGIIGCGLARVVTGTLRMTAPHRSLHWGGRLAIRPGEGAV
jgi:hypothetical protein